MAPRCVLPVLLLLERVYLESLPMDQKAWSPSSSQSFSSSVRLETKSAAASTAVTWPVHKRPIALSKSLPTTPLKTCLCRRSYGHNARTDQEI